MFLIKSEELTHFRILIILVILIGIIQLLTDSDKVSIKKIVVEGKNQIKAVISSETHELETIQVIQTGNVNPDRVVINTASFEDLICCPGIGEKKAKKIINERKFKPFIDWRDLEDRISGISKSQVEILKNAGVKINSED